MLRYIYFLLVVSVLIGCSHKSVDDPTHDINYYRQHFVEAKQVVDKCKEKLKDDKNYTANNQNCKDAFYVVVFDPSMESARRAH